MKILIATRFTPRVAHAFATRHGLPESDIHVTESAAGFVRLAKELNPAVMILSGKLDLGFTGEFALGNLLSAGLGKEAIIIAGSADPNYNTAMVEVGKKYYKAILVVQDFQQNHDEMVAMMKEITKRTSR